MPFFRSPSFYFLTGAAVGTTAAAAIYITTRSPPQTPPEKSPSPPHPALKHGIPITSTLRTFASYVAEYDPRLRNPRYVLEHFTADVLRGDGNRSNSIFSEDASISPRFRARLEDFKGSGFDRGHLAPAANHKRSQEAMDDTFVLTNVSPQVGPGFNRDYWARFERFVQEVARVCDDVYVVTGPLFLPTPHPNTTDTKENGGKRLWVMQHPMLGTPPRLVAVPTHFYKVVLGENGAGTGNDVLGAFVMPNSSIDASTPLASFSVPISALEEVAGISFFPNYLNDRKRAALDEVSLQWQEVGHAEVVAKLAAAAGAGAGEGEGDGAKSRKQVGSGAAREVLMLPASMTSMPTATASLSSGGSNARVKSKPPRSPGLKMNHICEHNGCRLPGERWWENGGKKSGSKEGQLRRTKSAPSAVGVGGR